MIVGAFVVADGDADDSRIRMIGDPDRRVRFLEFLGGRGFGQNRDR